MVRTRAQTRSAPDGGRIPALNYRGEGQSNEVRKSTRQNTSGHSSARLPGEAIPTEPSPASQQAPKRHTALASTHRKRSRDSKDAVEHTPDRRCSKRPRTCTPSSESVYDMADGKIDPVAHWAREGRWPRQFTEMDISMERVFARKRYSASSRKRSDSATSMTPSDQRTREEETAQYRDPRYKVLLATKGSFMDESELGIADASKALCQRLLEEAQTYPLDSLFRDDVFKTTCRRIADRNEARVIQDISRLLVPSAESLATFKATHLDVLTESVNEGWNNSIPLTGTRPQPDYSVGFKREAFTNDQLTKLSPFIGEFLFGDQSFFMATYYMYFPFLACEVKNGTAGLDVADRQNAHSATLAVRAVVELFRLVKCQSELHRQILVFSVSHNTHFAEIYGHYVEVDGQETKYYRYPINIFDFTGLDGKEKWTTYRFMKNIYDIWMPSHFKRICSAIDQLPLHVNFGVAPLPEETGPDISLIGSGPAKRLKRGADGTRQGQLDGPVAVRNGAQAATSQAGEKHASLRTDRSLASPTLPSHQAWPRQTPTSSNLPNPLSPSIPCFL